MILIQCTKKLLGESLPNIDLNVKISGDNFIGNFHANLFKVGRKKSVIFTNNDTLYSFIIMFLVNKDFKNLDKLFIEHFILNLNFDGMGNIANLVKEKFSANNMIFTKTSSASILGSMNDFKRTADYYFSVGHGVNGDTLFVNKKLNDMPMKAIGYNNSKEALVKKFNSLKLI